MSEPRTPWWELEKEDLGTELVRCAKVIEGSSSEGTRQELNLVHARMFENAPVPSLYHFGGHAATGAGTIFAWSWQDRSTENVLRSVIQTAASQICRNRPRARFVTTNGNWKQKRKAKKLTQFCDGLASETKLYQLTRQMWIDAAVFDVGAIQVTKSNGRIRLERVLPNELLIDMNDGLFGQPRTLYRRRYMDRDVMLAKARKQFGIKEGTPQYQAIKDCPAVNVLGIDGGPSNLIPVYESWHLGAADDGKGGKHAIAIGGAADANGATLFVEDWDKDYFPILTLRWEDAMGGPWGRSLAEQLAPMQFDFDKLTVRIEKAIRRMASPRIGVPRGSKIVKSKISNEEGSMIEFTGAQPPVPLVWPALTSDVYQERERRKQSMYDIAGVSRNAAQGQKETGVTSGEAIRESIDVQQARQAVSEQRWEQVHVDIFRVMVDFASDLGKEGGFSVNVPGKRFLESIDWKDVSLSKDEYTLEVYPTSYLPITPQGRLSTVQDLVQSGIWTAERASQALDDLDVEREMSVDQAAEHHLEQQMDEMLYEGRAQHPDEFTPFDKAVKVAAQFINMGEYDGAPEKHVDLVRRYVEEVRDLIKGGQPTPAPIAQPAPGAAPPMPDVSTGEPAPAPMGPVPAPPLQ